MRSAGGVRRVLAAVFVCGLGCSPTGGLDGAPITYETPERPPQPVPIAADAGPCVPTVETCNGTDEDCDGRIDEDAVGCAVANGTSACAGGRCVVAACADGYADCNGSAADGCETNLSTSSDCTACGRDCAAPKATTSCVTSGCAVAACDPGFADCDGDPGNGCEQSLSSTSDCGACGNVCTASNAVVSCVAGSCALAACAAGWGDCNAMLSDGCERRLDGPSSCGACGVTCSSAGTACVGGACSLISCSSGLGDCDGIASTGCETDLESDEMHCGVCGASCASGRECLAGRCVVRALQVAAGGAHTCVLRASGQVACWGYGELGQIGDGGGVSRQTPSTVSSLSSASQIAAGARHSCAVVGGSVRCWGYNADGQLGHGGTELEVHTPVSAAGIGDAAEVKAGYDFTCARHVDGRVSCWGDNSYGQLGNGSPTASRTPVPVAGISDAVALELGDLHACVIRATGTIACWGRNDVGQAGIGMTSGPLTAPMDVPSIAGARVLATGGRHTCAVATGGVYCWGANQEGQLGDGTTTAAASPTRVVGLSDALELCGGSQSALHHRVGHTCARALDGRVLCWGGNSSGQRGDGTTANATTPLPVHGLEATTSLACGDNHTCALRPLGSLECWGSGARGQLGNGSTVGWYAPVVVAQVP